MSLGMQGADGGSHVVPQCQPRFLFGHMLSRSTKSPTHELPSAQEILKRQLRGDLSTICHFKKYLSYRMTSLWQTEDSAHNAPKSHFN